MGFKPGFRVLYIWGFKTIPAGRSPITFYHATSDLPDMGDSDEYPHNLNGSTYRYYRGAEPDFKFGDGLTYTTFTYKLLAPVQVGPCETIKLRVDVTNTGKFLSDDVVQVYAVTPESSVPSPAIRSVIFELTPIVSL